MQHHWGGYIGGMDMVEIIGISNISNTSIITDSADHNGYQQH